MKLVQIAKKPEIWINVGTGAVSRVCETGRNVSTVVMNDGYDIRFPGATLDEVLEGLKAQEQDYEKGTGNE